MKQCQISYCIIDSIYSVLIIFLFSVNVCAESIKSDTMSYRYDTLYINRVAETTHYYKHISSDSIISVSIQIPKNAVKHADPGGNVVAYSSRITFENDSVNIDNTSLSTNTIGILYGFGASNVHFCDNDYDYPFAKIVGCGGAEIVFTDDKQYQEQLKLITYDYKIINEGCYDYKGYYRKKVYFPKSNIAPFVIILTDKKEYEELLEHVKVSLVHKSVVDSAQLVPQTSYPNIIRRREIE